MKVTASNLIRWSGLAAMAAGVIFAGIQPIHPPDFLPSVTTALWAIIMPLKLAMCFMFLAGITGIYARQVEKAGWLGLAGYLMLSLCWLLQIGYVFTETFILPVLATPAPGFVDSYLGIVNQVPGEMNIGALPVVYGVLGLLYMLGGLVFGIATLRASVLPKWPAVLLAVAATVTPAAALLPHAIQRFAAVPVAFAIAWLGFAIWTERRQRVSELATRPVNTQIQRAAAY
jgi:hypothetical protein